MPLANRTSSPMPNRTVQYVRAESGVIARRANVAGARPAWQSPRRREDRRRGPGDGAADRERPRSRVRDAELPIAGLEAAELQLAGRRSTFDEQQGRDPGAAVLAGRDR